MLVFENKGEVVGVSNPHPHGQIYATNFVFKTIETEARAPARHLAETGRVLFQDIIAAEKRRRPPRHAENDTRSRSSPTSPAMPTRSSSRRKRRIPSVAALSDAERRDLADVLRATC